MVILMNRTKDILLSHPRIVEHLRSICTNHIHKYVLEVALEEEIDAKDHVKQEMIGELLREYFWPFRESVMRGEYPPALVEWGLPKVVPPDVFGRLMRISKELLRILEAIY